MNITTQRRIDRWIGAPLCRLLSLWPRRRAVLPDYPNIIVVVLLSEMGSLVLAEPMFRRLRLLYPQTRIYALVFEKNRELLDLLDVVDAADVLTIRDDSGWGFIYDSLQVVWKLRQMRPAGIIDCELFARVSSLLARLSGARLQVGFHPHTQEGLYRGGFINRPVLYNPYVHMSQQYLNLAEALTTSTHPLNKNELSTTLSVVTPITFSHQEIDDFFYCLYQDYPSLHGRKLVLLYPGGGALPIRAWPQTSYLALTQALIEDEYAVGVIGLKSDQTQAQGLVTQCSSSYCVNLAGYTRNIRELLVLFQRTALLVTNDGGPGQFAALTKVPSIVLFGPETPLLYGPLSPNAYCFFTRLGCTPCLTAYNHRNTPCDGNNRCLQSIAPGEVIAKARSMLSAAIAVSL